MVYDIAMQCIDGGDHGPMDLRHKIILPKRSYSFCLDIVIVKLDTSLTCSLKNSLHTTKSQQQLLFTLTLAIPSLAGRQLTIDQAPNPAHSLG